METRRRGRAQKAQAPLSSCPAFLSRSPLLGFCLMLTDTHTHTHTHTHARINYAITTIKQLLALCDCITKGLRHMQSVSQLPETFWKPHVNESSPGMLSGIFSVHASGPLTKWWPDHRFYQCCQSKTFQLYSIWLSVWDRNTISEHKNRSTCTL